MIRVPVQAGVFGSRGQLLNVTAREFRDNFSAAMRLGYVLAAMEAGLSDHVWSLEEIAGLAE